MDPCKIILVKSDYSSSSSAKQNLLIIDVALHWSNNSSCLLVNWKSAAIHGIHAHVIDANSKRTSDNIEAAMDPWTNQIHISSGKTKGKTNLENHFFLKRFSGSFFWSFGHQTESGHLQCMLPFSWEMMGVFHCIRTLFQEIHYSSLRVPERYKVFLMVGTFSSRSLWKLKVTFI